MKLSDLRHQLTKEEAELYNNLSDSEKLLLKTVVTVIEENAKEFNEKHYNMSDRVKDLEDTVKVHSILVGNVPLLLKQEESNEQYITKVEQHNILWKAAMWLSAALVTGVGGAVTSIWLLGLHP